MESQLEEEKKLFLDAVKHLDFGSYVFSKNSAEVSYSPIYTPSIHTDSFM